MRKVVAIVQARMTSTRLPGKVMMAVRGKPLLQYELERLACVKNISQIVVATTTNKTDDRVADFADSLGYGVYRGSEDDVLSRYHGAAVAFGAEVVVRLTADCPLIDPEVVAKVVAALKDNDYASNVYKKRTFPRGLDTEVFTFQALEKAFFKAEAPSEREHVTPYIYGHPEIFKMEGVYNAVDLSRYRWTVDTKEDFTLIKVIIERMISLNTKFCLEDIVNFMDSNPELFEVNCHVQQKN